MAQIALLSVSDKQGLIPLAKALINDHDFQIISSGGTAKALEEEGIKVQRVADFTGAPEILGGRVKTLHPKIHGGILADTQNPQHVEDLTRQKYQKINLVVVNLYPFKEKIKNPNINWDEAIENIDIGGPTMIRAAAKNHSEVSILTKPSQYEEFIKALDKGSVDNQMRTKLAIEAFEHTAQYDTAITNWMTEKSKSKKSSWLQSLPIKQTLRYGENPHQKATWYSDKDKGWGGAKQLQGKELSTNNILDLEAAIATIREFGYGETGNNPCIQKAAVVIKHTNPCGVAVADSGINALKLALDADRVSAFGGIVSCNSCVEKEMAQELEGLFLECIVAPDFHLDAIKILSSKKNLRLIKLDPFLIDSSQNEYSRSILGGVLVQDTDDSLIDKSTWEIVTEAKPSHEDEEELAFAWRLVRHVRSNAIVITSSGQSLGIGAGQMNRIGAAKIALEAAGEKAKGSILASDGFFPFDDTIRLASKYGVKAIIQPGGSIRDKDSIIACNELGISMIITNKRHFLH